MTKHNPLIEPPQGMGRSRWRQTTRKAYINRQLKSKKKPLPAIRSNNNREELKSIPFPLMSNGKAYFAISPTKKNGFVSKFRQSIYVNPIGF